ncbi:MAG: hypothetical protein PHC95_05130 [Parabacteroides sp.]|nr:hypothetical protein [Parabacteroides sp.]
MLNTIYNFIIGNSETLLIVYGIGAIVGFILTVIFFLWIGHIEDQEREEIPEYYEDSYNAGFSVGYVLTVGVISILAGLLWFSLPLVLSGLWFWEWTRSRFPDLSGDASNEEDQE